MKIFHPLPANPVPGRVPDVVTNDLEWPEALLQEVRGPPHGLTWRVLEQLLAQHSSLGVHEFGTPVLGYLGAGQLFDARILAGIVQAKVFMRHLLVVGDPAVFLLRDPFRELAGLVRFEIVDLGGFGGLGFGFGSVEQKAEPI